MKRRAGDAFALVACAAMSVGCSASDWQIVYEHVDKAVLSVWGAAGDDVYFCGGSAAGSGPAGSLVLHFDGAHFTRLDPSAASGTATLWWVNGRAKDDVWFVGDAGLAVHWDGGRFARVATGSTATLYGVYVAGPNDVWAVGGTTSDAAGEQDTLLHYDGTAFVHVEPPKRLGITYFKVSGTSPSDVFVVGQGGQILHWNGTAFAVEPSGVQSTLLSVSATADRVLAVGGPPLAVLERKSGAWLPMAGVPSGSIANGVAVGPKGTALLVAVGGVKLFFDGKVFGSESREGPREDLHGAWFDSAGNAFAVGGSFAAASAAAPFGVIGRRGQSVPNDPIQ